MGAEAGSRYGCETRTDYAHPERSAFDLQTTCKLITIVAHIDIYYFIFPRFGSGLVNTIILSSSMPRHHQLEGLSSSEHCAGIHQAAFWQP